MSQLRSGDVDRFGAATVAWMGYRDGDDDDG